jgi:hypothetical protein
MTLHYYTIISSVKKSGDGDAKSLLALMPFMPRTIFLFLLCP